MDEMSIRQRLEYDGNQYYGSIDMGTEMNNDSLEMTKECFVLLIVNINENWKLPIGYFLRSNLKKAQKIELVRHALHVLESTGIKIISLTFDGCSTNITAAKLLSCNCNIDTLSDTCKHSLCSVERDCFLNSLITLKNKGGNNGSLIYPSKDVLNICFRTEKTLKHNFSNKAINKLQIQSEVLVYFLYNSNIFKSLKTYSCKTRRPLTDHVIILIKSITTTYINLKINYSLKMLNEKPSIRMWYNKLTILKGQ